MKLTEFKIGERFICGYNPAVEWQCTDIGTRVVTAILVKDDWIAGPPYAVGEVVFDEDDQKVCEVIK